MNERQRAIEWLKEEIRETDENYFRCFFMDIAIADMEKQIPKPPEYKVVEKYAGLGKNYYCACGVLFVDFEWKGTNFCGNCGQKLR